MKLRRTFATVAAVAALSLTAAGCNSAGSRWGDTGSSGGKGGSSSTGGSASKGASESTKTTDSGSGSSGTSGDKIPGGFPMPDGVDATGYGSGDSYSALLTLTDPKGAYDFWLSELPKKGFDITYKTANGSGGSFIAQISFKGNGYSDSTISIVGTAGALDLQK